MSSILNGFFFFKFNTPTKGTWEIGTFYFLFYPVYIFFILGLMNFLGEKINE